MNGSQKTYWILGALALAGGAYWFYAYSSAGAAASATGEGGTDGDASGGGAAAAASGTDSPTAQVLSVFQTIGESLGIMQPKGIRNNNPGNLRYVPSIAWKGQTGSDGSGYAVFDTAEDGIRAMGHELRDYLGRQENTVASIISTWAPSNENDTNAYIADVAGRLGVDPQQPLDGGAIPALAQAIIIHENGSDPYGIAAIAAWSTEA